MNESEFQKALAQLVGHALHSKLNPFLVLSILETAKLDLYSNLQAAQRQQARSQIVRGSMLPNGLGR